MLNNVTYNKTKLLCKLSSLCWFIENHAIEDAQQAGDEQCLAALKEMYQDIHKHLEKLSKITCELCKK